MVIMAVAIPARGQTFRGTIRGEVHDASGGVLAGAKVTAKSPATGLAREAVAAADGIYVIAELPAGDYDVTAHAKDLAAVTLKATVAVGLATTLDFTLAKVAPLTTEVTITGAAPLIETSRDVLGGIVEGRLAVELPLNGRDFGKLVALQPGVTVEGSGVAGTEKGFGQFNINGNRDRSNNYMLDGSDNNDPFFNNSALNQAGITGAPAALLPIDAIQEFNLESQFAPEYGRNSGAIVNVVTKSGTNTLHGSLFEYHRNSFFDARNFFNPDFNSTFNTPEPQTAFINNQFGGSLGGPIIKDRMFFFGAYEGQRERVGSDFNLVVPTPLGRQCAMLLAQSFNSAINTGPTDALLAKFFPAVPAPSVPPCPDAATAATATGLPTSAAVPTAVKDKNDQDNFLVKVEHQIGASHTFAARYAFGQSDQTFPLGSLGGFGSGSRIGAFAQTSPTRVQLVSLSLLSTVSANRLNELRFGYSRFRTSFHGIDEGFDPTTLGLNFGTGKMGLPEFDFSGVLDNLGATAFSVPRGRVSQSFQGLDNFTWMRGRHTWKFGGEVRRYAINNLNDNLERGLFSFSPSGNAADPVIDLLTNYYLGNVFAGCGAMADAGNTLRTTYNNSFALFVQDDFRVSPSLTVNYGMRWEYFGPLSEKHNRLSNLGRDGLLALVGADGVDGAYERDLDNFGPRVGLAWRARNKTVVRAAYGIYYDYVPQDLLIANFTTSAGLVTNPIGPLPVLQAGAFAPSGGYHCDAFAGPNQGQPVFTFPASGQFAVFVTDRNLKTPYMQSWNLNIEQQVGSAVGLQVSYVGSKGTNLTRLYDLNQAVNFTFPNPNFAAEDVFSTGANSTYHSLQLNARIRGWHGFSGFGSYVWSKSLDGASDGIDFNFASAAFPQDSTNLKAEKGPSTFDTRHRFTLAMNYQVPVCHRLPDRLAQGWQFNAIATVQSGRPIGIIDSHDSSGSLEFHQRPDVVPGVDPILNGGSDPASGYINPAAFMEPSGTPPDRFGNLGRNRIFGPDFRNLDFSVTKTTRLTERLNLELRVETFNILNQPNFALPSGVLPLVPAPPGPPFPVTCPGCVSTQTPDVAQGNPGLGGGGPRVLQFAARLQF